MAEKTVIIENHKTGEQYGVSVADFKKHYSDAGFKIVSHEDGTPFEEKEPKESKPKARRAKAEPAPVVEAVVPAPAPNAE